MYIMNNILNNMYEVIPTLQQKMMILVKKLSSIDTLAKQLSLFNELSK